MPKKAVRKTPRLDKVAVGRMKGKTTADGSPPPEVKRPKKPARRCNSLDGKRWLQNSISVWSDIRKSPEELRLKHPAMFPAMLAERLIESFLPVGPHVVLDPFAGTGSTLVAAAKLGKQGVGIELSAEFVQKARSRFGGNASVLSPQYPVLSTPSELRGIQPAESTTRNGKIRGRKTDGKNDRPHAGTGAAHRLPLVPDSHSPSPLHPPPSTLPPSSSTLPTLHHASAADLPKLVAPGSIDLCITSPPYWDILNQRRTADMKAVRHYGNLADDLGTIADYDQFLSAITRVFADVLRVLKPGAHCCVIVMDLRKKNRFYPFHSDLAARLQEIGFIYDDLIIWNRQSEYNNLRPLGFPAVFRVNKVHEFVLLMQKPAC